VRKYPLLIIGGGLSGLAAGIRFARFGQKVLILEKHSKAGGLNSYYYRKGRLLETGLHAITNYAPPEDKHAPLNRLLRQLKIPRRTVKLRQQKTSEILFPGRANLCFSNDFSMLQLQIAKRFPGSVKQFAQMLTEIDAYDAFAPRPKVSARTFVATFLQDRLLLEMIFCPLMFYGGSDEDDMDLSQFIILFRAIFQEGFFRPEGTIKDLLGLLLQQYKNFGGEIEFSSGVKEILTENNRISGIRTDAGEVISCDDLISTAGFPETKRLFSVPEAAAAFSELPEDKTSGRLSFLESIYLFNKSARNHLPEDRTIIFYNLSEKFSYRRPDDAVDLNSGVICFPDNFERNRQGDTIQMRVTHLANYEKWLHAYQDADTSRYPAMKTDWTERSRKVLGKIIGNCSENIVYEDSFTPVTIERFTSRTQGAVYGSSEKIKDGRTYFANLYIAGTDQGYLGIVGALLSGVTMVNQHIFNKM
jgi:phytoene dehydrogenase-like protein